MKNKKLTYVLISGVIVIWGLIIYRIFSGLEPEKELPTINPETMVQNEPATKISDSFGITVDYSDPFLDRKILSFRSSSSTPVSRRSVRTQPVRRPPAPPKTESQPERLKWPEVIYSGVIENDKGTIVALMAINNQDFLMQAGHEKEGIKVEKIYEDSVKLTYNGEIKVISK